MRTLSHLSAQLVRARRVAAPLLAILTPDPAATMALVLAASAEALPEAPAVAWDAARGLHGINEPGRQFLAGLSAAGTLQTADALAVVSRLPEAGLAFLMNAHRFLDQPDVAQAVWNLRDPFKADGRALVMLAPHLRLPAELAQDVLVLQEPLPGESEIAEIVRATYSNAQLEAPDDQLVRQSVQACLGLSAFSTEQALALSLKRSGMDLPALWSRKRQAVEQTPGLSFSIGGPGYSSIAGLAHVRDLGSGLFAGPLPPRCVIRVDELEKQFAGSPGDTTGIAQDFSSVLLRCMQDYNWSGLIAVGPPGSGKSLFSRVLGAEFNVPTLEIDLGACKGSLVGESEANIRACMRVIHALAGDGGAFFIATCNSVSSLPPELRRRFRYGNWMFELPTAEEREPIWQMYIRRFELDPMYPRPSDELWTGADIYNATELAYRLGCDLIAASAHLLPVARSAAEQIRSLRELADGRFLSASYPGPYHKPDDAITPAPGTGRRIGAG